MKFFIMFLLVCASAALGQEIKIINPSAGNVNFLGVPITITWKDVSGLSGDVDIYISRDAGTSWEKIASGIFTSSSTNIEYKWVSTGSASMKCKIKIEALYGNKMSFSSYAFQIKDTLSDSHDDRSTVFVFAFSQGGLKSDFENNIYFTSALDFRPTIFFGKNQWGAGISLGANYVNPTIGFTSGFFFKGRVLSLDVKNMFDAGWVYMKLSGVYSFANNGAIIDCGLEFDTSLLSLSLNTGRDVNNNYWRLRSDIGINIGYFF